MVLEYYDSGIASAAVNMRTDSELLAQLQGRSIPLLHIYRWRGLCATYGYFCTPERWLDTAAAAQLGVELARRPTGGGITLHTHDLAFSFLLPVCHRAFSLCTLTNYAFVNQAVARALTTWCSGATLSPDLQRGDATVQGESCRHFCMARPTQYDVMVAGRKVGGAAQRRTRHGYLHQGTIALSLPEESLLRPLLRDEAVWQAMQRYTHPLVACADRAQLDNVRVELCLALYASLESALQDASVKKHS